MPSLSMTADRPSVYLCGEGRPGDFGTQSQHQVALTYKLATTVDCGQLTDTWRDAIKQAHRKFDEDAAAPGEFILKSGDVTIAHNLGQTEILEARARLPVGSAKSAFPTAQMP